MKGYQDYDNQSLYITSLYFTVTTIVTVGYGDITPYNNQERSFVIFLMLVGVISFSFATSTLSVLMTKYDFRNEIITQRTEFLQELQDIYSFESELFNEISNHITYNSNQKSKDIAEFAEELPHKLRV